MNRSHKQLVSFKSKDGFEVYAVLTVSKKRNEKELGDIAVGWMNSEFEE